MGLSEERSDDAVIQDYCQPTNAPTPTPFRRRATRLSIRVTNYAYSKLCKLKPRFSVGNVSFKPDYEDLKTSPTVSPEEQPLDLNRKRLSHMLTRQEAMEEKRGTDSKQSSEKSEPWTLESQLSDEDGSTSPSLFSPPTDTPEVEILEGPSNDPTFCDTNDSDNEIQTGTSYASFRRRRKFGNTLEVPSASEEHRITAVEYSETEGRAPRYLRVQSVLEYERRSRIKKLQSDLQLIQKDMQDLDDLEYEVSVV